MAIEGRLSQDQAAGKQLEFEHKTCGSDPMSCTGIFLTSVVCWLVL